jgi:predicted metal-dependent hydrolase
MRAEAEGTRVARVTIGGEELEFRVRPVAQDGKLRIRVGVGGVEVLQPMSRTRPDVEGFLQENGA